MVKAEVWQPERLNIRVHIVRFRIFLCRMSKIHLNASLIPKLVYLWAGISEYASTPDKASDYISPLLSFAAQHIPKNKHQETPLYILCTAGMRVLPERYLIYH